MTEPNADLAGTTVCPLCGHPDHAECPCSGTSDCSCGLIEPCACSYPDPYNYAEVTV